MKKMGGIKERMKKKTRNALFLGGIFRKWREATVEQKNSSGGPPYQVSLRENEFHLQKKP